MMTKQSVLALLDSIDEHSSPPSENEAHYVGRCRKILARDGALPSSAVVLLHAIRDGQDSRAGLFESDWDLVHDFF